MRATAATHQLFASSEQSLHCCLQTSLVHCSIHRSLGSVVGNSQYQPSHSHLLEQLINNFKGREGTNLTLTTFTYILIYLLTRVRQIFVTCYVHTTNSTILCVMQWMQLFLSCNEMPTSGPRPLHGSQLAYLCSI